MRIHGVGADFGCITEHPPEPLDDGGVATVVTQRPLAPSQTFGATQSFEVAHVAAQAPFSHAKGAQSRVPDNVCSV
jgi:hypothetical protein